MKGSSVALQVASIALAIAMLILALYAYFLLSSALHLLTGHALTLAKVIMTKPWAQETAFKPIR